MEKKLETFSADEFSALEMIEIRGGAIKEDDGDINENCPNTYCDGANCVAGCGG
jgi:hypothetical protein